MNTANVVTIAIPTLAILFGILLNRQDATAIRSEMKTEIGQLRTEMIQLRNSIHTDMASIHERIATVEARQSR